MYQSVPLDPLRVLTDTRDKRVLHLVARTRRYSQNDLIQRGRAQDVDMIARRSAPSRYRRHWIVGKLRTAV